MRYSLFQDYKNSSNVPAIGGANAILSRFFQRYLLQKAMSIFLFTLPENWDVNYFMYTLYCNGHVAIINTDKFGIIPQACSLYGYDVFYRPNRAQIANPLLKGILNPQIGKQCALIKLQPDYGGVMDLVTFYADLMALTAQAAGVNLQNSKLSYLFTAENKAVAETFKQAYAKIANGEPLVIADNKLFKNDGSASWQSFFQNVGQNYITDKLLDDLRKIEQRFDTAIGIPNANTEKKERLIVDEVNANNIETYSLCTLWFDELKKGIKQAADMFGVKMDVCWRFGHDCGGVVGDTE